PITPPTPSSYYTLSLHDALPISDPASRATMSPLVTATIAPSGENSAARKSPTGRRTRVAGSSAAGHSQTRQYSFNCVGFLQTTQDRKSTRLNSSHGSISYAVFCL